MANEVDLSSLIIEIDADASTAGKSLDSVASALSRLNANSRITRTVNNLTKLRTALTGFQSIGSAADSLTRVSAAVSKLSSLQKLSGLNSALNTLKKFPEVVSGLDSNRLSAFANAVQPLSSALSGLTSIDKLSGLNSALNTLKKLPEITKDLEATDLDKFASELNRVKTAIQPLATEMQKVSAGFADLPKNVQKVISSNSKLASSNAVVSASYGGFSASISGAMAKLTVFGFALTRVADYLGSGLANYNAYVENVNLFTVSMGEFTEQAAEFTQAMQDILGVDASEAMRNMGVIQNLVTSFGAASDQAYVLSKNLTQLGYDFASFFNISTEDAFTKLQAAISGELEPIRRLGVDISEARLQQELYNLGIDASVESLGQADKALLRYIAIMNQTSNAQTDMARTLNSPANMMRVFQAQMELLARSIGSLFIPMLNAILPPLIAVVQVIREAISAIAALFGVSVDFSTTAASVGASTGGISSGLDDVAGSAAGAAKEMAYLIGGFDELNVMSSSGGSGGGSGGASGGGGGLLDGITLPDYDMYEGLVASKVSELVKKIKDAFSKLYDIAEPFIPLFKGIAAAIGTAFAISSIVSFARKLKNLLKVSGTASALFEAIRQGALGFTTAFEAGEGLFRSFSAGIKGFRAAIPVWAKVATVAATSVGAFVTAYDAFNKLAQGSMSLGNALGVTAVGLTAFAGVAALVAGPVGVVVTLVAGATGAFFGYKAGIDAAAKAAYESSIEYTVLNEVLTSSAEISERAASAQQTLNEKIADVNTVSNDFGGVRILVDDIFDLSEKSNKSATELVELRTKVDALNSLNLEGIQLELDETGTHVLQTRDSVDQLVDSLEKAAYQAAIQEVLTEAYKQQIQAQLDLATATQDYNAAVEMANEAQDAQAQYLKDAGTWGAFFAALGLDQTYTALEYAVDDANAAVEASNQAIQDAQGVYDQSSAAIDTYTAMLQQVEDGTFQVSDVTQGTTSVIEDAANKYQSSASVASESAGLMASSYAAAYSSVSTESQNSADNVAVASDYAAGSVENAATRSENALSGLPEKSSSWGSDFATNFANGFSQAFNSVKNAFTSAAEWIAERFHFSVPDKGPLSTADTWMPDMMDLFTQGVQVSKPKLFGELESLGAGMRSTMAAAMATPELSAATVSASSVSLPKSATYKMGMDEDMVIAIVAAIQALQQTVEDKDFDVSITEGDVGRAAVAYGTRQRRRTGKNPFSA